MQPPVHAQPRVRVMVIEVKCYNIIQPQHVKCKQNGGWTRYCAFVWENTEERKPKNRGKSRKAFQETTLAIPPPQMSCLICIFIVVDNKNYFNVPQVYLEFGVKAGLNPFGRRPTKAGAIMIG